MQNDWFKDWFSSEEYNLVYLHRDDNDARKLIDLIIKNTALSKSNLILDGPCGSGRHLNYLITRGFNVVGFDLSKPFLIQAKNNALKSGFSPLLLRADIRDVYFKREFDAVLNLFTSFGYFQSDEENFSYSRNAYSFIKKGGFFVLDYFNKDYLTQNLIPLSSRKINSIIVEEKREIKNDRVVKTIKISDNLKSKEFYESVKLYSKDFILERFLSFGYSVHMIFGDYNGNEYNETTSERLIIIFKK
jgi:SAM-dependent methyltransferase